jgi:hypothetical protein
MRISRIKRQMISEQQDKILISETLKEKMN